MALVCMGAGLSGIVYGLFFQRNALSVFVAAICLLIGVVLWESTQ